MKSWSPPFYPGQIISFSLLSLPLIDYCFSVALTKSESWKSEAEKEGLFLLRKTTAVVSVCVRNNGGSGSDRNLYKGKKIAKYLVVATDTLKQWSNDVNKNSLCTHLFLSRCKDFSHKMISPPRSPPSQSRARGRAQILANPARLNGITEQRENPHCVVLITSSYGSLTKSGASSRGCQGGAICEIVLGNTYHKDIPAKMFTSTDGDRVCRI